MYNRKDSLLYAVVITTVSMRNISKIYHPKNEHLNANVKIVNICLQNFFFCVEVWLMSVYKILKQ